MRKANEFVTIGVVSALTLVGSLAQAAEPAPARRLSTVTFTYPVTVTPQQLPKSNERTFRSRAPHLQETPAQQRFVDVPPTSPFSGQSKYNDIELKRGRDATSQTKPYSKTLTFTLSTTTPAPPPPNLGANADGLAVSRDVIESTKGAGINDLALADSSESSALRRSDRFGWKQQQANLGMNHAELAGGFNGLSVDDSSGSSALRRTGRFAWKDQHANLGLSKPAPGAVATESLEIAHEGFLEERKGHEIEESIGFVHQRF